jgi:hypothetical protein
VACEHQLAEAKGAKIINGLFLKMDMPEDGLSPYVLHFIGYDEKTEFSPWLTFDARFIGYSQRSASQLHCHTWKSPIVQRRF